MTTPPDPGRTQRIHPGNLIQRLRAAGPSALPQESQWATVAWEIVSGSSGGTGMVSMCGVMPTDSSYGVGYAEAGLFSSDLQTCYCVGASWWNPGGTPQSGQIGVPLTVLGGTDFYTPQDGETFTGVVSGVVYSPTGGSQPFDVVTTVTVQSD